MDSVGNVAEGGLAPNAYRVVFLKKTATGYAFVSPYYPSIRVEERTLPYFEARAFVTNVVRSAHQLCTCSAARSCLDRKAAAAF